MKSLYPPPNASLRMWRPGCSGLQATRLPSTMHRGSADRGLTASAHAALPRPMSSVRLIQFPTTDSIPYRCSSIRRYVVTSLHSPSPEPLSLYHRCPFLRRYDTSPPSFGSAAHSDTTDPPNSTTPAGPSLKFASRSPPPSNPLLPISNSWDQCASREQ